MLATEDSCFAFLGLISFFCIFLARVHFDGAMKEHETEAYNGQDQLKRAFPTLAWLEMLATTGCSAQNTRATTVEALKQKSEALEPAPSP